MRKGILLVAVFFIVAVSSSFVLQTVLLSKWRAKDASFKLLIVPQEPIVDKEIVVYIRAGFNASGLIAEMSFPADVSGNGLWQSDENRSILKVRIQNLSKDIGLSFERIEVPDVLLSNLLEKAIEYDNTIFRYGIEDNLERVYTLFTVYGTTSFGEIAIYSHF